MQKNNVPNHCHHIQKGFQFPSQCLKFPKEQTRQIQPQLWSTNPIVQQVGTAKLINTAKRRDEDVQNMQVELEFLRSSQILSSTPQEMIRLKTKVRFYIHVLHTQFLTG